MFKTRRKSLLLLLIIVLLSTQFACEAGHQLLLYLLSSEEGLGELECTSAGGKWIYDTDVYEWVCDYSNGSAPAPEPPLWSEPEESAPEVSPPEPEAVETLEPEECNQRAAVDIGMGPNDNTVCDCAYFVHFTSYEETILYYRTQSYFENEPTQRWQVQRLYAGETWTWSSEKIKDGACIPAWIDAYTVFIAIEGCDNMAKRAHWAIDEYARSLNSLCP